MAYPTKQEMNDAQVELQSMRIDLFGLIGPAVKREAAIDVKLREDLPRQRELTNQVLGAQVVFVFALLQSRMGDLWGNSKTPTARAAGPAKPRLNSDQWERFDCLKYVRDCFAHSHLGEMFPMAQKNTQEFVATIPRHPDIATINGNQLELTGMAVDQALDIARTIFACYP